MSEREREYVSVGMDGCVSACVIKCECVCVVCWVFDGKGAHTQAIGASLVFEIGYPMHRVGHSHYQDGHLEAMWGSAGCGGGRVLAGVFDA